MNASLEDLRKFFLRDEIIKSLILVNIAGTAFGFYYYRDLMLSNSVYLWPVIPDSPASTLFIALSFFLYLKNRGNKVIDALAFIGNVKYGLWTVFVLLYMNQGFLEYTSILMYGFLLFSHLAMFFQAFLVLEYSEISMKEIIPVGLFFLVNDVIDYSLGVHAYLPEDTSFLGPVSVVAFSLTVSATLLAVGLKRKNWLENFV